MALITSDMPVSPLENLLNAVIEASALPAGVVSQFAGTTAPLGYLLCQGQAVSRSTYASLYSAVGTAYGVGDGSATFNVPDFRGRVPVGLDSSQTEFDTLGDAFGAKTHTLTTAEIPSHSHTQQLGGTLTTTNATSGSGIIGQSNTSSVSSTGGGGAHNNVQPSRVVNFIIKT